MYDMSMIKCGNEGNPESRGGAILGGNTTDVTSHTICSPLGLGMGSILVTTSNAAGLKPL